MIVRSCMVGTNLQRGVGHACVNSCECSWSLFDYGTGSCLVLLLRRWIKTFIYLWPWAKARQIDVAFVLYSRDWYQDIREAGSRLVMFVSDRLGTFFTWRLLRQPSSRFLPNVISSNSFKWGRLFVAYTLWLVEISAINFWFPARKWATQSLTSKSWHSLSNVP